MRAAVVLPVKRFAGAKRRLEGVVSPADREALAAAMLGDVLAALGRAERVARMLVVTGEDRAAELARASGAAVLDDPDDAGHSEAARRGAEAATADGAECVAMLPADCPLLAPDELDAALEASGPGSVGVVPDRHGTGTNGLILSPPDAITPAFGPGSRDRHLELARRAGRSARVVEIGSLALDLDTGEDLAALIDALRRHPSRAPATAAAVAALATPGGLG